MAWWAIIREWPSKFHVKPLAFHFHLIIARVYRLPSHKQVKILPLALKLFSAIQRFLPVSWKKKGCDSAILPGNSSSSSLLPSFNHFSLSLPLISSPHPTLPQSPYQKGMRDKGNIWQSATLPTSHPSSINAPPPLTPHPHPHWQLVYTPPCFFSPLAYLCLLWAKAWRHVSGSLEKYTSFQGEINGFHLYSGLLVLHPTRQRIELQRLLEACCGETPCSHKSDCQPQELQPV